MMASKNKAVLTEKNLKTSCLKITLLQNKKSELLQN